MSLIKLCYYVFKKLLCPIAEGNLFNLVAVYVPEITADVLVPHVGKEIHVLAYLMMMLGLGGAELEVDDNPLMAVSHHSVRAVLTYLVVFYG